LYVQSATEMRVGIDVLIYHCAVRGEIGIDREKELTLRKPNRQHLSGTSNWAVRCQATQISRAYRHRPDPRLAFAPAIPHKTPSPLSDPKNHAGTLCSHRHRSSHCSTRGEPA
jgi:hypothetical protein